MPSRAQLLAATAAVVGAAVLAGVAAMASGGNPEPSHFESCRATRDGTLVLGFTYGSGDRVTADVHPTEEAVEVSLTREAPAGLRPAIQLLGELRVQLGGGLGGRAVQHPDGTVVSCRR